MAQYRAMIQGSHGSASRLGGKNSGMLAIVNGWTAGVRVEAGQIDGRDTFKIYKTGGSNAGSSAVYIGCVLASGEYIDARDRVTERIRPAIEAPKTRATGNNSPAFRVSAGAASEVYYTRTADDAREEFIADHPGIRGRAAMLRVQDISE